MSPAKPSYASIPATRERILSYLKEHRTASSQDLSRAWGLTRADIRYHLNALLDEGLVEIVPRDPTRRVPRGRPVQYYRLAAHATPNNLPALCHLLLQAWLQFIPEGERDSAINQLAINLTEIISGGSTAPQSPTRRFNQAISQLNRAHYHAHWEAHSTGPRILLRNCPYAAILADHPELCVIDRTVLEKLFQLRLSHTTRMDLTTGNPSACVFDAAS